MNGNIFLYFSCFLALASVIIAIIILVKMNKNCCVKDNYAKKSSPSVKKTLKVKTNNPVVIRNIIMDANQNLSNDKVNSIVSTCLSVFSKETNILGGGQYLDYVNNDKITNYFDGDSDSYTIYYVMQALGFLLFFDQEYKDRYIDTAMSSSNGSNNNNDYDGPSGGGNFGSNRFKI